MSGVTIQPGERCQLALSTCVVMLGITMSDEIIRTLRLSPELRDQMVIHMAEEAPNEGVGLLAVIRHGDIAHASAFFPGENIDASPTRFTMHPRDVLTTLDTISRHGWELGAIVHSHPVSYT